MSKAFERGGTALISARNAAFSYDGVTVLEGLSFAVHKGDYLSIVGVNGAGKSTLMKGLLRIKAPSGGAMYFDTALKRSSVGYLPQQTPQQKDFPASVFEVTLSGRLHQLGMRPFYTKKDIFHARDALYKLGMEHASLTSYRNLSGGQQQRVLLARALCATETLLLLDEPTAGLDPTVTKELYGLIASMNRDMGITVIMISHDIAGAMQYSSHILHLHNKQLFFGATEEFMKSSEAQSLLGGLSHVAY